MIDENKPCQITTSHKITEIIAQIFNFPVCLQVPAFHYSTIAKITIFMSQKASRVDEGVIFIYKFDRFRTYRAFCNDPVRIGVFNEKFKFTRNIISFVVFVFGEYFIKPNKDSKPPFNDFKNSHYCKNGHKSNDHPSENIECAHLHYTFMLFDLSPYEHFSWLSILIIGVNDNIDKVGQVPS